MFEPDKEEILPKLLIFNTLTILPEAIEACSYDKKKIEDIAEFSGDDPIDGLRYLVDAADNYVRTAQVEMEKIQKQENLVKKLEANKDWTAFYRNMRATEKSVIIKAIKRYH
jgi:hypothetical protein